MPVPANSAVVSATLAANLVPILIDHVLVSGPPRTRLRPAAHGAGRPGPYQAPSGVLWGC